MTYHEKLTPRTRLNRKNIRKKTLLERTKAFFAFLEHHNRPVYVSELKAIGMDSKSVKVWVEIIQLIRTKPPLIVETAGRYTTIQLGGD